MAIIGIAKDDPVLSRAEMIFETDQSTPQGERSLFVGAADFLNTPLNVSYIIKGIVERDTTGQIFGPSGGGKTFVAVDVALAAATGGITLNGKPAERGLVLYLAGEGHNGLKRRVLAWQKVNWQTKDKLDLLYLSRHTISFEPHHTRAVITEAKRLVESHQAPLALIIIDTLARHINGDENSTVDMSAFIHSVDTLRAAFPGSVALIVHHTGHGDETKTRGRGSSALRAAMDFEILCDKGLLTFTKMKDSEAPKPIEFKLCPVQIGTDEDGEPITSCVVKYGERSETNKAVVLTTYEKMLHELISEHSELSELKLAFYDKRKESDPDLKLNSLNKSFHRTIESLTEKKLININGSLVVAGQVTGTGQDGTSP